MNNAQRLVCFRRIAVAAVVLCVVVVVLGAWVRLTAAGLGCPDWPTCYGHVTAGGALQNQEAANAAFPDRPLEYGKALREMVHRYAAGTLGLLIALLAGWAVWNRRERRQPVFVPVLLLFVVAGQAALGMLTVTWLLKPLVVTLHLIGGMTTLGLLWWLAHKGEREFFAPRDRGLTGLRRLAILALVLLGVQIALGGWTSSNYAAVACPDFPLCQGQWWPQADYDEAFVLWRGLGINYEGGVLDHPARVAIHLTHRIGAVILSLLIATLGVLALARARSGALRMAATGMLAALGLQLTIGIVMVTAGFPLFLATAHNAGAAVLMLAVISLLRRICATTGN